MFISHINQSFGILKFSIFLLFYPKTTSPVALILRITSRSNVVPRVPDITFIVQEAGQIKRNVMQELQTGEQHCTCACDITEKNHPEDQQV